MYKSHFSKCKSLSIYASNQFILYTTGFSHEFFSLSKGQCINGDYPGIYKTTLVLKQDGNLVNYVYDIQNDITYIAFASDSAGLDVSSASFYFDSNVGFNSVMLELLSSDYSVIKHIVPTPTKASNKTLGGSLALGGMTLGVNSTVQGLTAYDKSNDKLHEYGYNVHPVNYVDVFFDKHTLATRDAQYIINILDSQNVTTPHMVSCTLPFESGDCYGKVKYVEPNHYLVYLEDSVKVEIAKVLKQDQSKRGIYFSGKTNIYFGWNDNYAILLSSLYPQTSQKTYSWTPYPSSYSSALHLFSWDDTPSIPDGSYKETCDLDSMIFKDGILSGECSYIDDLGIHWLNSSLDYDQMCKSDPSENDQVSNKRGILSCQ